MFVHKNKKSLTLFIYDFNAEKAQKKCPPKCISGGMSQKNNAAPKRRCYAGDLNSYKFFQIIFGFREISS
ncbi:hypothetical protein A2548_06275 [candidate division WOR-1 bacterium RIFOXYD2_FULL_41_8]|nr:MAG: hypothetical protein A2548_06275 [candidate division WOR-1 bacterium RIFOXYD2_FULL_41_8]